MRKSFIIPALVFGVFIFVLPHLTHAAISTNNFGPIVTNNVCNCNGQGSAPDLGCILGVLQNALSIFASFALLLVTIYIAWAGLTYMLNPNSPEARQKGNKRLINAVLGLLIILCSWLLIDTVMKVIYNSSASGAGGVQLGPWNSILDYGNASQCLRLSSSTGLPGYFGNNNAGGGVPSAPPQNLGGAGGACSAQNILAAVQGVGGSISQQNASVLACLAAPESSCGTNPKALTPQNNGSSALGPFQVTVQSHAAYFNNPQCEAAAGVSGPLNCQNAFSRGNPIPGPTLDACVRAADNMACEAIVASQVYQKETIKAWTADPRSTTQGTCG